MASKGNIGIIVIQRDDGVQTVDHIEYFELVRDDKTKTSQAIFYSADGVNRFLPAQFKKKITVNFDSNLSIPTLTGWMEYLEIKNYDQTALTNDQKLLKMVANLNREQKQIIQDLIIMNTTLDEMFKEQKNWLKENAPMMMVVFAIMILAVAIYQQASQGYQGSQVMAAAIHSLNGSISHMNQLQIAKAAGNVT